MENNVFSTHWDQKCKIITVIFMLLFFVLPMLMIAWVIFMPGLSISEKIVPSLIAVMELSILIVVICLSPLSYIVEPEKVIIKRMCGKIELSVNNISTVEKTEANKIFNKSIRIAASGGAFGYYGKFISPYLGNFDSYVTRVNGDLVIIKLKTGFPIVLSPDDVDKFLTAINKG